MSKAIVPSDSLHLVTLLRTLAQRQALCRKWRIRNGSVDSRVENKMILERFSTCKRTRVMFASWLHELRRVTRLKLTIELKSTVFTDEKNWVHASFELQLRLRVVDDACWWRVIVNVLDSGAGGRLHLKTKTNKIFNTRARNENLHFYGWMKPGDRDLNNLRHHAQECGHRAMLTDQIFV